MQSVQKRTQQCNAGFNRVSIIVLLKGVGESAFLEHTQRVVQE